MYFPISFSSLFFGLSEEDEEEQQYSRLHAVQCQKVVMTKAEKGVKMCHKLGETQDRAMKNRGLLGALWGLVSINVKYLPWVKHQGF